MFYSQKKLTPGNSMAIRVVPSWAKWAVLFGLFAPILGAFGMLEYNPQESILKNVETQNVTLPFFRGQNPVACMNESIRMLVSPITVERVHRSASCVKPTRLPYRYLLILSLALLGLGGYRYINPEAIADKWPTSWGGGTETPANKMIGRPAPGKSQRADDTEAGT
jgi:hypothetical protein